jgi:hypothetical protein
MPATIAPKPAGLGIYYFPDDLHYRQKDLEAWLPEIQAMNIGWITLRGSLQRAVPEAFVRGLIRAGLQPVIHIPAAPIRPLRDEITPLLRAYAGWGVRYVSLFAPPNLQSSWSRGDWQNGSPVDLLVDAFVPIAKSMIEAGLEPVFPAMHSGGDYWDLAFLEAALAALIARGEMDLLAGLTLAVEAWTYNRPVAWGAGGAAQWPSVRPYLTPPDSQDQLGFGLVDWVQEIVTRHAGQPRPVLVLRGGAALGDRLDANFPAVDEKRHLDLNSEIARMVIERRVQETLLNVTYWLLAADPGSASATQAWYRADGTTLPIVTALRRLGERARARRSEASHSKVITHYLLVPGGLPSLTSSAWQHLQDYLRSVRPTIGDSIDEAVRAERVTLFGENPPAPVLQALRNAGCVVDEFRPLSTERSPV